MGPNEDWKNAALPVLKLARKYFRASLEAARKKRTPSILPPLAAITLTLCFAGAAIALLSGRATKAFYLQASCEDVRITSGITLNFDRSVDSFFLTNFRGRVDHIDHSTLPKTEHGSPAKLSEIAFEPDLQDPTGAPPSLLIERTGTAAPATIQIHSSLWLRTGPTNSGRDRIDLTADAGSKFDMQAQGARLEASRFKLDKTLFAEPSLPDTAKLEINSQTALVQASFTTPAGQNDEDGRISATYASSAGRVSLINHRQTDQTLGDANLSVSGCSNSFLQIVDAADYTVRDRKSALTIQGVGIRLHDFFVTDRDSKGDRLITIMANGSSRSILQEQHQLLPTFLEDTLSKKPYQTGLLGALMIFSVFAGGVFLKRAFDVLAKRWIPD